MNSDSYKYVRYNVAQETRWATKTEIEQSSSFINLNDEKYPAAGLPLISDGETAYVDNLDTHSLIFGATGSKKTRLFCMPMINIFANAGESFIVTDPKGEIYAQTSGLAKERGYKTVVLNFRDLGKGDMWNPLSLPKILWKAGKKSEAGMLLSDFMHALASEQLENAKDPYWPETAQALGLANLYVLMESAKDEEITPASFTKLCSYGYKEDLRTLSEMLDEDSLPSINYQSTVCISAETTVSCIMSTLSTMLRIFNVNKTLSAMLSDNTFDIRRFGKEKTAVYIIVPDEKTTYHFLVTSFIKQTYEILIAEAQKEKDRQLPVRVNFVLDEFCNIPRIPDMPSMISAARSRNMRFYLVAQSMHQLRGRYGEDAETIKGNCDNWIFLTSKELSLLNEISELCGKTIGPDGKSRPLISVSELQRLNKQKGETLIIHARQYPIINEMADISQYKMFGIYPPVEMVDANIKPFKLFSIKNLLSDIKNLEKIAPFASEAHMIKQAEKIYEEEKKKANIKVNDDRDADVLTRLKARREGVKTLPPRVDKNAEEIAKERAKERIAKIISPEFAERFFAENLKSEQSNPFDFDFDF